MPRKGKSREDWVKAGQQLLMSGGIEAVKLHDLTAQMNVSTGSFYHHFKNFDDYLTALADFFGSKQAQKIFDEAKATAGDDPIQQLHDGAFIHSEGDMRKLYLAMKGWAHGDERAAVAVQCYDSAMMTQLDQIFLDLGFDELAAKSRTLIMMGLQSHDIDQTDLKPSLRERWFYIRDLITNKNH